jgi:NAD(P)-dependent dehydrogenase (short-subunit alcohol dehydrogenase family)
MRGKTILITGATDGIGRQTGLELARKGADVWVHGRDEERCRSALAEVRRQGSDGRHRCFTADLADPAQVRGMTEEVLDASDRLDVLICNAGVFRHQRELTEGGVEITFAVNHLAHFALTLGLVNRLRQSAPSRIVVVSSMVQADAIDFENLQGEKRFSGFGAYARSKLCNVLFTRALARRLEGSSVTANCLHPGVINTKLLRASWSGGAPVAEGAKTPVFLASSSEMEGVSGNYFVNRQPADPAAIAEDRTVQERLWKVSEDLTGLNWPV